MLQYEVNAALTALMRLNSVCPVLSLMQRCTACRTDKNSVGDDRKTGKELPPSTSTVVADPVMSVSNFSRSHLMYAPMYGSNADEMTPVMAVRTSTGSLMPYSLPSLLSDFSHSSCATSSTSSVPSDASGGRRKKNKNKSGGEKDRQTQ